ncbi:HesB/IscA family protein [Bartonella sp. DGB1]|uniref:HesB/IscA family protein n=1 Tax=Bartonella sp. DGB1 TaxID=3239807 RepID=UPI003525476D
MMKNIVTITEAAKNRIRELIKDNPPVLGLRLSIKKGGCAGKEYVFSLIEQEINTDDKIIFEDGILYIDSQATLFLLGTEIGYEETDLRSGFTFKNPNQISACGCGESVELVPADPTKLTQDNN